MNPFFAAKLRGSYDETAPRDPLFAGLCSTAMPGLPGMPQERSDRSIVSLTQKFLDLKRPGWVPGRSSTIRECSSSSPKWLVPAGR